MFKLQVTKTRIEVLEVETVTSGQKNATDVKFCLSDDWKGLTKTAFFKAGKPPKEVTASCLLTSMNTCKIPPEVLTRHNVDLYCGIRGKSGEEIVVPTIWAKLGEIKEGVSGGDGDDGSTITPEQYDKLLDEIQGKQDALEGKEGQYVGFDEEGNPIAKDWPDNGGGGGTTDHRLLDNRDAEAQHPMSAIEGLEEEIKRIPPPAEALTNQELEELLK